MKSFPRTAAILAATALVLLVGCGGKEPEIAWTELEPGLQYADLALGSGAAVGPNDFVQVHYTGWYESPDSLVEFDSSLKRGEPIAFPLGRNFVISGWEKGLPGMAVGGKRKLRIAPDLAYGVDGRPPVIPGNATLIFDVEIVGLPRVDITSLEEGDGPEAAVGDNLSVHYTGWLWEDGAKGTEFDSSMSRGRPYQFTLGAGQVIPGWDVGLTGMKQGTKARLVIPPEMAYGARGSSGAIPPNATLCFDVELVAVEKP